jgi:uncharacterized membrane protein YbhN (UPF0104 family)
MPRQPRHSAGRTDGPWPHRSRLAPRTAQRNIHKLAADGRTRRLRQASRAVAILAAAGVAIAVFLAGLRTHHTRPAGLSVGPEGVAIEAGSPLASPDTMAAAADLLRDLSGLATDPVATIRLVGGACAVHLGYLLCLVVSLRAAGIDLNPAVAALAYFAGSAVADLAPTPGGLGAAEVALAGAVATLGVQTDLAVAGVLIYRLATYWLLSIAGYVSWMAIRHKGILTVRPATGASPQSSPDAGRSRWPAPRSSGVPVRHVQCLPGSQL